MSDFDVFNEGKTQSFFESQQAVMALCTYLEGVNKNMKELSKNQLLEHFNKLLKVSILSVTDAQTSTWLVTLQLNSNDRDKLSLHPFSVSFVLFRT